MITTIMPPMVYMAYGSTSILLNIQPQPPGPELALLEIASIKIKKAAAKTMMDVKVIVFEYFPKIFLPLVKNIVVANKIHEVASNAIEVIATFEIFVIKV
jgi:hypothetical protein